MAQGYLALERNWQRSAGWERGGRYDARAVSRTMERKATPQLRLNWRFQQALYRAYYDAYLRARLHY